MNKYYFYNKDKNKVEFHNRKTDERYFLTEQEALEDYRQIEAEAKIIYEDYKKEFQEFMKDKKYKIGNIVDTEISSHNLTISFEHKSFVFNARL